MFITSFGEQNITYKCCSNFLIHLFYQFKAVVTDVAGNISETSVQKVVVDTTAPQAGELTLSDLSDTGVSATDQITQDNNFTLKLAQPIVIGEQAALLDHYEVSTDEGKTWQETTADQKDLADGSYLYKAVVTDLAGNTSETGVEKVIIDNSLNIESTTVTVKSITEDNIISLVEKDQVISIRLDVDNLPTDLNSSLTSVNTTLNNVVYNFHFDEVTQEWVTEIPAEFLWSEESQTNISTDISLTDQAGNTAIIKQTQNYNVDHTPNSPTLDSLTFNNIDGAIISGSAYKGSKVDIYNKNGDWLATTIANEEGKFTLQDLSISTNQEIYAVATYNGYSSENSSINLVTEVPAISITRISPEGVITGYATEGSHFIVKDQNGNILQEFNSIAFEGSGITPFSVMALGEVRPFTLTLNQPLEEGTQIIISFVESGYWENQLVESGYRDVDFGGHDKIISSVSYSLVGYSDWSTGLESGRYVEDLELVGSAHLNATGNALDNLLTGNSGNNVLNGREGNDTYMTNEGTDSILFQLLNSQDATGGNGHDTVLDFTLGDVRTDTQADKIDLSELLIDYSKDVSTLAKFITVEQDAGNTTISLDRDGEGTMFSSVSLITLNQVNTTLDELLNNQQLFV